MAQVFKWIRPGYELVTVRLQWNVNGPLLNTRKSSTRKNGESLCPFELLSPPETQESKWLLGVFDLAPTEIAIRIHVFHHNSDGKMANFVEPVQVKMSIKDRNGKTIFQPMPSSTKYPLFVEFLLPKEEIIKSECQQSDGSYTFCCKIFTHVKQKTESSDNPSSDATNCLNELSTQLEELFDSRPMPLSDVNFNVHNRYFPAHKNILAARSEVFSAMFQDSTKENLTNKIEIEDIEPDVFQEMIRFIYTGRVQVDKLEIMAAGLFIAADKYRLNQLKMTCENYVLRHMSPENCVVLLSTGDLQNPTELLKEAAKFFRRLPSQVMATARWEKMEEENPRLLCRIQKFLLIKK